MQPQEYTREQYSDILNRLFTAVQKHFDNAQANGTVTETKKLFVKSLHAQLLLAPSASLPYGARLHAVSDGKGQLSTYRLLYIQKLPETSDQYIGTTMEHLFRNQPATLDQTYMSINLQTNTVSPLEPTDTSAFLTGEQGFQYIATVILPYLETTTQVAGSVPEYTIIEGAAPGPVI